MAVTGAIPFARFMELALYCPQLGYYERKQDNIGRGGDFYTNVSTGPLFGELVAFQFAEWLEEFKIQNSKFKIAEASAHDGKLAADILNWLQAQRPQLYDRLEYLIIEPSPLRQQWQRETLAPFAPRVRWLAELPTPNSQLPTPASSTIIFSNELLDAMPVHRLGWDAGAKKWFEWGVTTHGDQFAWTKLANSEFRIPNSELESVLPDGYTVEICPAAAAWWRQAADALPAGKLLTIDYGYSEEKMFVPERTQGTLRAYHRHQVSADLLAQVGEQDLTAHVNFTALQRAGEAAGLRTEAFESQSGFLTRIAGRAWKDPGAFGEPVAAKLAGGGSEAGWTPARTRQFQTLTHPEHLGRAFRVLVQSK